MKKTLLLGCAVGLGLAANAQVNTQKALTAPKKEVLMDLDMKVSGPATIKAPIRITPVAKTNAVTIVNMGTSSNAYGVISGTRTNMGSSNAANTVFFNRRQKSPSGNLGLDVSSNGGASFTNSKTLTWQTPANGNAARYPKAVGINPPGNTNSDNMISFVAAPALAAKNGATWGSFALSATTVGGVNLGRTEYNTDTANNTYIYWPEAVAAAGTKGIVVSPNSQIVGTTVNYLDSINIITGTYNGTAVTFANNRLPFLVDGTVGIVEMAAAFDNTGTTGYIIALSHTDFTSIPDSNIVPVVMKTTNGGATWSAPVQLNFDAAVKASLKAIDPTITDIDSQTYCAAFEIAATVDANGKLHFAHHIGVLGSNAFSVATAKGYSGTFYGITDGTTLTAGKVVGTPGSLRGTIDATNSISSDTRPAMSRNEAGTKIFCSWFETDTAVASDNTQPDLLTAGYDVASATWGSPMNLTKNTLAEGAMLFGNVAPIVFENAGGFEIPASFTELYTQGNCADSVGFRYLKGATIPASYFSVGTKDLNPSNLNVSKVYPNPSNGVANMEISLDRTSDVKVSVANIMGQVVSTKNFIKMNGKNIITIDTDFPAGIYFINVEAAGKKLSQKLIVE